MDDHQQNPYAAPPSSDLPPVRRSTSAFVREPAGVWREAKILVMHRNARLPELCVKTGSPAELPPIDRKMSWHTPWIIVTVFLGGILIYIILAYLMTKSAVIQIPVSNEYRAKRKRAIMISVVFGVLSIIGFLGSLLLLSDRDTVGIGLASMGACLVFGLIALGVGSTFSRILKPTKITDTHVWLGGVHPSILAELPELPKNHSPVGPSA